MLYLTGPNRLDWQPSRNSTSNSSPMWPPRKPAAAISMIPISPAFTQRTRVDLRIAVGELSGGGREQHERQDEDAAAQRHQLLACRAPHRRALVRDQDDQRVLEEVVVEGAEKLRPEEPREAAGAQQPELAGLVRGHVIQDHGAVLPDAPQELVGGFLGRLVRGVEPQADRRRLGACHRVEVLPSRKHVLVRPLAVARPYDLQPRRQQREQQWAAPQVGAQLVEAAGDDDVVDDRREAGREERVRQQRHVAPAQPQLTHRLGLRLAVRPHAAADHEALQHLGFDVHAALEPPGDEARDGRLPGAGDSRNHDDCPLHTRAVTEPRGDPR